MSKSPHAQAGGLVGVVALALTMIVAPSARAEDVPGDNGRHGEADSLNSPDIEPHQACNQTDRPAGASRIVRHLPSGPIVDGKQRYTAGICVYLPSGYDTTGAGLQYPVLYLLHGGGGDQADWVNFANAVVVLVVPRRAPALRASAAR